MGNLIRLYVPDSLLMEMNLIEVAVKISSENSGTFIYMNWFFNKYAECSSVRYQSLFCPRDRRNERNEEYTREGGHECPLVIYNSKCRAYKNLFLLIRHSSIPQIEYILWWVSMNPEKVIM